MSSPFDLVIFDCDGTLVDSETMNNVAIAEILGELGLVKYTPDYSKEKFIGKHQKEIWELIAVESGRPLPADINQRYIDRVAHHSARYLRPAPGVLDLVARMAGTHKVCVASNGEIENVRLAVESTGLAAYFPPDQIFTAAMVAKPKPAPDLFLHAAAYNNVAPDRAIVIEDSLVGAAAGLAAGMVVYGYAGLHHDPQNHAPALKDLGVHHVSHGFDDLYDVLALQAPARAVSGQ